MIISRTDSHSSSFSLFVLFATLKIKFGIRILQISMKMLLLGYNHFVPCYVMQADGSRVSSLCPDGVLLTSPFDECHTLVDCFLRGLRISQSSSDNRCLGRRPGPDQPFSWTSYQDVFQRAKNFGSGKFFFSAVHISLYGFSKFFDRITV